MNLSSFVSKVRLRSRPSHSAMQFVQELAHLPIAYHFDVEQGYHAWNVWQTQLYHALLWLQWG
jgi:S-formylglutathione hydrolase FrmB